MQTNLSNILISNKLLEFKGNYWKYLTPDFNTYLENYLNVFERHRLEIGMIPKLEEEWMSLPYGNFAKDSSWKWRRQSLNIVKKLIEKRKFDFTLEIGSWNGWLTKYLANKSKTVIASDYFVCQNDGIGNIQKLAQNIIALQCNVEEIKSSFKPKSFDLIILNHNISYMNNPSEYLEKLMPLLTKKGMIISIGATFYKNPERKIKFNKLYEKSYLEKYNSNLFIQPIKGYMDKSDKNRIRKLKFKIKPYNSKFLQNFYCRFNSKAPFYCYLIFEKND